MRIKNLFTDQDDNREVVIVGTGPSLRVAELWGRAGYRSVDDPFYGMTKIGLNRAWRYAQCDLMLTAHPELYLEWCEERDRLGMEKKPFERSLADKQFMATQWVVKGKKAPMPDLDLDDPHTYVYKTSEDWNHFIKPPEDTLFLGRGIHQTGMQLAYLMGARRIWMLGVDMTVLGGEHHAGHEHVQYHGLAPQEVMSEYYVWAQKARDLLLKAGVRVWTASPFLGLGNANTEYNHLKKALGLSDLPSPKDVSKYTRKKADI